MKLSCLATLLALAVAMSPPARADLTVTPIGQLGGFMASVAVPPGGGPFIYSGEGSGLGVWNVADQAHPVLAGGLPLSGSMVNDIQFNATGTVAYLANGDGLQVVSLADPLRPVLLGSCATTGSVSSVAVVNSNYVLVASAVNWTDGRIRVVNVADPAHPTDVGGYDTPGLARQVCVVSNRAYVADGWTGLQVLDLTTPTAPQFLGSCDPADDAVKVQVAGLIAYAADPRRGLHLINVTNPAIPVLLATTETNSAVADVCVVGTTAFVLDSQSNRLNVVNVSTPAAPVRIGSVALGWSCQWGRLAVSGGYAYVACPDNGLVIVNVSSPAQPVVAGAYERPSHIFAGTTVGTTGYLMDPSQFWICDYTNPAAPVVLGKCDLGHSSFDPPPRISVSSNTAVIALGDFGMPIVNVADPRHPVVAGRFVLPPGGVANDVFLSGTRACLLTVSNGQGRLHLVDIANPATPTELGGLDTPGDARRLAVSNNLACVADGAGGVRLINIATPAAPVEVGHIDPPAGTVAEVAALESHPTNGHLCAVIVFNATNGWRLQAYDLNNPATPVFLNEVTSATGHLGDLVVRGNRAYAAGSFHAVDWVTMAFILSIRMDYLQRLALLQTYVLMVRKSFGLTAYAVEDTPPPDPLARIDVTPSEVSLQTGNTRQFTATGYDANNNPVPITPTWTTTGGGPITTGGVFTATTVGNFTVTATDPTGKQGSATVHVTPGQLVRIDVTPSEVSLQTGNTRQFTATGYDANNNQVPITPTWTTTGGGPITTGGVFTATTVGNFTVTASVQGSSITGTAQVHVRFGIAHVEYQPATGQFVLSWVSTPGRVYDVYRATCLACPDWQLVASGLAANTWSDPVPAGGGGAFYRVVERTP